LRHFSQYTSVERQRTEIAVGRYSPYAAIMDEIRWHLRFRNLRGAFALLSQAVDLLDKGSLTQLEREGTIQRFEYTWELAWKTLRDLLLHSGVQIPSLTPANVIRAAFDVGLIADGDAWFAAMKARNQMSHEYDSAAFERIVTEISGQYFPLIAALVASLEAEIDAGN
jgi:nucleotidyltransferase substrate binding protein (TIGR01987 family)